MERMGMKTDLETISNGRHLSKFKGSGTNKRTNQNRNIMCANLQVKPSYNNTNTTANISFRGRISLKSIKTFKTFIHTKISKVTDPIKNFLSKITKPITTPITKFLEKQAEKLPHKEAVRKILLFVNKNEVLSEALFAGILTCLFRPLCILAIDPKKESKEKNKYAAVHSIASGTLGVIFAVLVNAPIRKAVSKAVDILKIEKDVKIPLQTFMNKTSNTFSMPFKATGTIALIPVLLGIFGLKKNDAKQNANTSSDRFNSLLTMNNEKKIFQNFAGVSSNADN